MEQSLQWMNNKEGLSESAWCTVRRTSRHRIRYSKGTKRVYYLINKGNKGAPPDNPPKAEPYGARNFFWKHLVLLRLTCGPQNAFSRVWKRLVWKLTQVFECFQTLENAPWAWCRTTPPWPPRSPHASDDYTTGKTHNLRSTSSMQVRWFMIVIVETN